MIRSAQASSTEESRQTIRGARIISLAAGLVVVASQVLVWLGHKDFARTLYGLLVGALVGLALGLLGPGLATSLTRLIGGLVRPLLVVIAIALAGAAALLLIGGTDAPNTPVSLIAATIMVLAWVPITRLSGR